MKKRSLGFLIVAGVVISLLFAIRQISDRQTQMPYRIGLLPKLEDNFDPVEAMDVNKTTVLAQICAKLTTLGGDLQVSPDLAKSWKIDDSRTQYIFELSPGRKNRSGEDLTADDVKFSIERFKQSKLRAQWTDEISKIQVLDPYRVQISVITPNHQFLGKLSHPAFCISSRKNPFNKISGISFPNSSGAYFVDEVNRNSISLSANPTFPQKQGVNKIQVSYLDQSSAIEEFRNGRLDDLSFYLLSEQEIAQLASISNVRRQRIFWSWMLQINPGSLAFENSENAKLFREAFDPTRFAEIWDPTLKVSKGPIPNGLIGFQPFEHDQMTPGNSDHQKINCKSFSLAIIKGMPKESTLNAALSRELQPLLNCKLSVSYVEMGDFHEKLKNREFDAYFSGISSQSADPLMFFRFYIGGQSENRLGYNNNDLNTEFRRVLSVPLEMRTKDDYSRVNELFSKSGFAWNIGSPEFDFVFSPKVKRADLSPLGMAFNQWFKLELLP